MKKVLKIGIVLMIIMGAFLILPKMQPQVFASVADTIENLQPEDKSGSAGTMASVVNNVLGFLQIASGLLAVVMIAVTGFRYIMETPDMKNELKKSMIPIIVGILLVFFASTIARFFISMFETAK